MVCYAVDRLPPVDLGLYDRARQGLERVGEVIVPPREARTFEVPAGHFFRIVSIEGPQVGDLNLWNVHDLDERFFSGKTRALHATHVTTGDRLWSSLPALRPLATITSDSLKDYGIDEFGGRIHDPSERGHLLARAGVQREVYSRPLLVLCRRRPDQ